MTLSIRIKPSVFPDNASLTTMDQSYQDAVAQYISQETGFEVGYAGGEYANKSKGSTISYSYFGSSQEPVHNLDFFSGGVLSFVTEIYGMGEAGEGQADGGGDEVGVLPMILPGDGVGSRDPPGRGVPRFTVAGCPFP